ncbi:MAG: flagellar biosynthetic protein FliR [Candidatus Delongbacteria bacterium]|nr:flagellar biosynthetic protein FliR [Candidatus Delongbacteria bacterium]
MWISFANLELFALVLIRISTMIMLMPVLGYTQVPGRVKIILGLVLTLLLLPVLGIDPALYADRTFYDWVGLVFEQVAIGVFFGFISNFVFMAVQLSGQIIGMQMGFGIVNVLDPESGLQVSTIGQMKNIFFLIIFLGLNGHHFLIQVMVDSFSQVPPGTMHIDSELFGELVRMSGQVFSWALRIGVPVMASLFLTEVAMGIVARTVPQMNIFIVGFPVKIGMGLILLMISAPVMVVLFQQLLRLVELDLQVLLRLLAW